MQLSRLLLLAMMTSLTTGHGQPIWELLPRREKMGQIMYMFTHLVDQTCSYAFIPDCHHVLTLHGLTSLINLNEISLSRLNPYQYGAKQVIWDQLMRRVWNLQPAHLPYYLEPEGNEITANEISNDFSQNTPISPQPSFYPYVALPNTHNKPIAAVSNPHPYAIQVTPPPGFLTPQTEKTIEEVRPEDRFASWKDSDAMVGDQQTIEDEFQAWSNGDVIVGNQEPVEDIFASWSDAEEVVSQQQAPEDRFAAWSDVEVLAENQRIEEEDRFANWNDVGMINKQAEDDVYSHWSDYELMDNRQPETDRFADWNDVTVVNRQSGENVYSNWNEYEPTDSNSQTETDRFANWNEAEMVNRQPDEDVFISWSESETTDSNKQTETDRFSRWSDSDGGLNTAGESRMPLGIQPTANFEPVMMESRVVVSQVPPPSPSFWRADSTQEKRKRRSLGALPLLLLRQ